MKVEVFFHEREWHKKTKIYDKNLDKWDPKTNKIKYHNFRTSVVDYIRLHNDVRPRATTQVRLTSLFHPKS